MSLIDRVQRRLRGELMPPPPFPSRDSIATRLFSLDDEPHTPSRELLELAARTIPAMLEVDLSELQRRKNMPAFLTQWPGEHYLLLAALVRLLQPAQVIEIGTFTGIGTLSLRRYLPEGANIATFDIVPWQQLPHTCFIASDFIASDFIASDFNRGTITQYVADLADPAIALKHRDLLASASLIFIDGPHDGPTEYRMLEALQAVPFKTPPLLVFDDIKLPTMLRFWRDLPYPKLDFTSLGHWSGTGLAKWKRL